MTTYAESPHTEAPSRARALRLVRRPLAGGVLWIALLGTLLAGVVAINVLVLQLNVQRDELGRRRAELKSDVALLESRISSAAAAARIERDAREKLGLVAADSEMTTYVRLTPEGGSGLREAWRRPARHGGVAPPRSSG